MDDLLGSAWIWWAAAIAIGVPLLLIVLTEIAAMLQRRSHPAAKPVRFLRTWVVPVAALFALLAFGIQSPAEHVWTRIVATVLGFLVILLVLSSFNVALFSTAREGTWRDRIPSIFVELARLVLVVVGLGLLFQWVWGADVGGLITALGVTSIVIGLALQNAVGGVISGLLLLFEQPFTIGDWLEAGGEQGRVVEVNWRAVHIDTGSGIQIMPNSTLSAATFRNLSRPAGDHRTVVDVTFATTDAPHAVVAMLVQLADGLPMLAEDARPSASYGGGGTYSVTLPVATPALAGSARSLFLGWLWYAARRHGFSLDGATADPAAEADALQAAVERIAPVLRAGEEERATLLKHARLERWGAGEILQLGGVVPAELRYVLEGAARTTLDVDGGAIDVDRIEPGDSVGQTAFTHEPALTTATAIEPMTVLTVPLEVLDLLVKTKPQLAQEIGRQIDTRRARVDEARQGAGLPRPRR